MWQVYEVDNMVMQWIRGLENLIGQIVVDFGNEYVVGNKRLMMMSVRYFLYVYGNKYGDCKKVN